MLPKFPCRAFLLAVLFAGSTLAAPEPKNFLFEDAYSDMTTETPDTEPVTSVEYLTTGDENLPGDNLIASSSEPAENILASASSTSSASSTNNAIGGNSAKNTAANHQANLLLLQQLQQQLQRQQQLKTLLQQQSQVSQQQQQQQPQFSIDALLKSFVKVFQVAKTKIDQGARTMRDIMQFFDRKKYTNIIPQASETNLVLT